MNTFNEKLKKRYRNEQFPFNGFVVGIEVMSWLLISIIIIASIACTGIEIYHYGFLIGKPVVIENFCYLTFLNRLGINKISDSISIKDIILGIVTAITIMEILKRWWMQKYIHDTKQTSDLRCFIITNIIFLTLFSYQIYINTKLDRVFTQAIQAMHIQDVSKEDINKLNMNDKIAIINIYIIKHQSSTNHIYYVEGDDKWRSRETSGVTKEYIQNRIKNS